MATCGVLVIVTLLLVVGYVSANKRLVLHSDDEVLQALSTLQTEFSTMTTKLQTEVDTLTAKLQMQNDTWTSKLQTEVSTLTSKFQAEISSLKSTLSSVTTSNIGSTYIRWGRTVCPGNGSELIYHGRMAGSKDKGGSSKSLCLPSDPLWGKYVDGYQGYAVIYGTEIDLDNQVLSSALFGKNVYQQNIPCAVCRSSRSAHVMIPARYRCYDGWTEEYAGYLVSGHPSTEGNFVDYVCLDESLEFAPHGASNNDEHVIYPVEVRCGNQGSLPCPPFVDGRELACVVCTK